MINSFDQGLIMFNIVEKNQNAVKAVMIIVTASFVFWGLGSYIGMSGDDGYIAKVGDQKIYESNIDNVMQQNKQYTSPDIFVGPIFNLNIGKSKKSRGV